jgi:hypothetical protein
MVDFIGIGTPRSATTWVSDVLRRHPEVGLSEPKEVRYFNRYLFPLGRDRGRLNPDFDRDIDWYLRHFRAEGRVRGEFTPLYLYDEAAPAAIERHFPDVKLLCCLRNPVDRAYSHYLLYRNTGTLPEMSFEEALEREPVFLEMGFYARPIARYLERFDREQVLFLLFDDLVADADRQVARVLEFLGVRDDIVPASDKRNRAAVVRRRRLKRAAHAVSRSLADMGLGAAVRGLRHLGVHELVRRIVSSEASYPPMHDETRRRLVEVYARDVAAVERMLDLDLGAWKARPVRRSTGALATTD